MGKVSPTIHKYILVNGATDVSVKFAATEMIT